MSFTCPTCYRVSYNPNDEREGYCGNCHAFTGAPQREFYGRFPDGQLRPRSSRIATEPNGAMQLPQEHKEPQTDEQVPEVQRHGEGNSMWRVRGERMEQDPKQAVSKVSGERSFIETYRTQLIGHVVWALSGIILGISTEQVVVSRYPTTYQHITSIMVIAVLAVQFVWLIAQFLNMRKWSRDLRAERQGFMEYYNAQVDKLLPDDPIEATKLKMAMELRWPKP